jgi:hypothetical protein
MYKPILALTIMTLTILTTVGLADLGSIRSITGHKVETHMMSNLVLIPQEIHIR